MIVLKTDHPTPAVAETTKRGPILHGFKSDKRHLTGSNKEKGAPKVAKKTSDIQEGQKCLP
jgi:hypothetical protein